MPDRPDHTRRPPDPEKASAIPSSRADGEARERRVQGWESGENSDYADWKINEEYPAPGKVIDQEAAQYRTEDGAQQHRYADHAHGTANSARPGRVSQDRYAGWQDHPAAQALKNPENDQRSRRPRRFGRPEIFNSDQGTQFTSEKFI